MPDPLAPGNQSLTPRTPRRFRYDSDLDELQSDPTGQDAELLLPDPPRDSSEDDTRTDTNNGNQKKVLADLFSLGTGIVLACVLLLLTVVSIKRFDILDGAIFGIENDATRQDGGATVQETQESSNLPADFNIISYQNYSRFPLTPSQYRAECWKLNSGFMAHVGYWAHGKTDVVHHAPGKAGGDHLQVCKSTITYMLGGGVGLLADLALMAQVAGLARERNRTFLIDDTYWNRGKWSDYFQDVQQFQPGLEPGCKPPPPEELVACPRTARHWARYSVVNSQTALFHFTHQFFDDYEDPFARQIYRLRPIYKMARDSFTNVFRPNAELVTLIREARSEFAIFLVQLGHLNYVSVHIRRGDRLGMSWKYHTSHVPVEKFAAAAQATWERLNLTNWNSNQPAFYIASDSPSVQDEFISNFPAETSIYSLSLSGKPKLRALASPKPYVQSEFNQMAAEDRIRLTKGMIIDFAMLSGIWNNITPAATVCGLSSNICRLSALGFGWEGAFGDLEAEIDNEKKKWVEIDNAGQISPVWEAFEVFP